MIELMPRETKRIRWWWIVLVGIGIGIGIGIGVVGVVLFAATGVTQGACYDSSDPAASYCTTGTLIPSVAVPYLWGAYVLLVGFLIYLAIRSRVRR
ncbi:hypothetical protein [Microbacterium sp. SORGH_AS_0888]|uniref:hypothetical protein n=1 Tax=Microbacterium sp. SORGH_AS_0888 TaxID=3041791 RepID=UPI00277D2EBF|nr:hypothetical protein [Microbacterium sp. SORGH_AS_0888]MDQ1128329.1 ABC-type antimicrobial peptide transport system permease subunit [Microbacterium sp. SORGH_AS_0888]